MKKRLGYFCWINIALLFLALPATAEILQYQETFKQAVDNSFVLKMSSLDIDISKSELKAARADLYPVLSVQVNSEYNKDLSKGVTSFAQAGNTVISPYTQFKDLGFLTLSHNLFDFGITGKRISIAKKDVEQKKIAYDLQMKDLKLKILDLYTKTLQCNNEISTKAEILNVYEDIFNSKERLFKSGSINKVSLMNEAVKIAKTQDEIENSKLELKMILNDLSSYTNKKYEIKDLKVLNFDDSGAVQNIVPVSDIKVQKAGISENEDMEFSPEKTKESKYYDFEIEKKKAELDIYKRQRLPSFKLYSNYSLYGQNPNQLFSAIGDVSQRSASVGIVGTYVFFDGFKNKANQEKTSYEIKRIQLEKEKKLNDIKIEYEKAHTSYESYLSELTIKKDLLKQVKDKEDAIKRMSQNGLISNNEVLAIKSELLKQELELRQNIINISSKIKEIQIITGKDV